MQAWEHFFKPEIRNSGQVFLTKGKVSLSRLSDTEFQIYIRTSPSFKVILKSKFVSSNTITADCTCPSLKRGQLCKHIWAALLAVEDKHADFFDGKTELEKKSNASTANSDSQAVYKQKQTDYRKQQYQKQKQRLQDQKKSKKALPESTDFPPNVELALQYFLDNGFPLKESMTKESVGLAKKKLARIFHPDVGGSHNEILELNKFAEVLAKFSKT